MTVSLRLQLIGMAVAALAGCMNAEQPQIATRTPTTAGSQPLVIALLGDQTRIALLNDLALASNAVSHDRTTHIDVTAVIDGLRLEITTSKSDSVLAHASTSDVADLAVVAVDARNGPMPVHREHILFARQMHIPTVLVAFTHSDAIDDPELLELEELELRELLGMYDYNGDEAIVAFDSSAARIEHVAGAPMGAHSLLQSLSRQVRRSPMPSSIQSDVCILDVYALAEIQAFPLKTKGIVSGEYTLVLGASVAKAMVHADPAIAPGETGFARVTFDSPVSVRIGQRCAIVTEDHIAAAAVITGVESETQMQRDG
jgi:hypothetical protein